MDKWALIIDDRVREIIDFNPSGKYHPSFKWIKCNDNITIEYMYNETNKEFYIPEPEPISESFISDREVLDTILGVFE